MIRVDYLASLSESLVATVILKAYSIFFILNANSRLSLNASFRSHLNATRPADKLKAAVL